MSLADSLVWYVRFRCGLEDISSTGIVMERVGSDSSTTYGKGGTAGLVDVVCEFDNTDVTYLRSVADDSVLDFGSGDFTISFWLKPISTGNYQIIMEKFKPVGGGGGDGWTIYLEPGGSPAVTFGARPGYSILYSRGSITFGSWNHVLIRRNGSTFDTYINGSQAGADYTNSSAITDTTAAIRVGERVGDVSAYRYRGQQDEIAVWSRALSDDEITEVYNSGTPKFLLGSKVGRCSCPGAAGGTVGEVGWRPSNNKIGGFSGYAGQS